MSFFAVISSIIIIIGISIYAIILTCGLSAAKV